MHCLAIKMHERARNMRERERERTIAVLQHSPCGHNGSQYRQIGNIAINAHTYVGCVAVAAEVCMRVAQREREAQTQTQTQTQTTITMTV